MRNLTIKQVALAGVLIALGLVLPMLTVQIPVLGQRLLPMHLPVLLGGFVLGAPLAGLVGFILPILRSILFGMPPFFPTAVAMSFELWTYGFLAGWFYRHLPRKNAFIYVNLILAMIGGRLVWGMVSFILYGLAGTTFTWGLFVSSAFWVAMPGIVIQIILIPAIVIAVRDSKKGRRA
ncbi:MAG: ECF transporter S component [Firmicutes bacterium]|jgi:riboflavin transporter FmnP|nr:ECF transporter S component [Bacillota bacterium]